MSTTASQSQPNAQGAPKAHLSEAQAADRELYKTLSRLHREQLRPAGPVENTLVETIIHNCFQIHHIQHAERETNLLHLPASLIHLGRLVRYRAFLERSTREALAQLSELQRRRVQAKTAVMAASVSALAIASAAGPQPVPPARSVVHPEPARLPIPHPIDQPDPPGPSAALPPPPGMLSETPLDSSGS